MSMNQSEEICVGDLRAKLEEAKQKVELAMNVSNLPPDAKEPLEFAKDTLTSVAYSLKGVKEELVVFPSIIIPNPIPDPPFYSPGCLMPENPEAK